MTRYIIIALAVLTGAVLGLLLARLSKRRGRGETTLVEEGRGLTMRAVLPWLGALAVLGAGLFLLADHDRAPADSEYSPAVIGDGDGGKIKPGSFGGRKKE